MAVVPNNAVNQARSGHLTMWKAVAAGQAGHAGVFAALLACTPWEDEDDDGDGILNGVEEANGTDPALADSDDDGVPDEKDGCPDRAEDTDGVNDDIVTLSQPRPVFNGTSSVLSGVVAVTIDPAGNGGADAIVYAVPTDGSGAWVLDTATLQPVQGFMPAAGLSGAAVNVLMALLLLAVLGWGRREER